MNKKKLVLKKFHFHPIVAFILLIGFTIILSSIFSLFEMQASYVKINQTNGSLETTYVAVENLISYDGIKYIISNAGSNFMSFTALSTLLIALIGLSVAKSTGLLDTFIRKKLVKLDNKKITFIIILLATVSSLINEIGYAILIPLAAIVYMAKGRNPLTGIITAYLGVAFGYGVSIFVGSIDINLTSITESAARLIDTTYHVAMTSNIIIIIVTTLILSLIGTIIIEKTIVPKLGRYKENNDLDKTMELQKTDYDLEEQKKIELETLENKGLKNALIAGIIIIIIFIYMLIPKLPYSGILLDRNEVAYVNQLFGENSYFQDGFNYMVSIFFMVTGIAYGLGAKTIKNDKDLIYESNKYLMQSGHLIGLIFFSSQFIAIFKKSNIGTVITAWGANIINSVEFTGLPLVILALIIVAITNLFNTTPVSKWTILAPVFVPKLMQSNISPEFAQFILRAGDSMTKGITPLLAYFVIFIGYLNIYNQDKKMPITITDAIKLIAPYTLYISLTWIAITVLWYIIGLPIGIGVFPTLG